MEKIFKGYQDILLADLESLISGSSLVIGNTYYVTDKDWYLYANSSNTLKPVSGSLHLFNGQELPTGIEPDVLFIDTGIIDWNIDDSTGTPLILQLFPNYQPIHLYLDIDNNTDLTDLAIGSNIGSGFFMEEISVSGWRLLNAINQVGYLFDYKHTNIYAVGNGGGNTFRAILEFHRSELSYPIPVPHIVSADIYQNAPRITFDCDMNEESCQLTADYTFILNGQVWPLDGSPFVDTNDHKSLLFTMDGEIHFNDIVTVSIASGNIKNTWGGLLEAVVNYPVVNNLPEPVELLYAEVNSIGQIELTFNSVVGFSNFPTFKLNGDPLNIYPLGISNNIAKYSPQSTISYGDIVLVSLDAGLVAGGTGYGINAEVVDYPVVNNVPES